MMIIHDGRVRIGELSLSVALLDQLRPGFAIPGGYVTIRYDGTTHIRSDGRNQSRGPVPWPAADSLLADTDLAADIAATFEEPVTLESAKLAKRREINAVRDAKISLGLPYSFPGGLVGTVDTRDQRDFDNLQALTIFARILDGQGEVGPVIAFVDAEDQQHALTPLQMIDLGVAVTQKVAAIYAASWPLKASVTAATTLSEVAAVDTSLGWP